ncbi:hypothetical protein ACFY2M_24975 [Streptomyces sp. NPDC001276]|uniref:hypothetical protein n=1 Tax=Streptomyces sp. NPDC001276 TaxID=3364555 RepID=UPI00368403E2
MREEITRESVLKALAEYDELGRETFLSEYGYGADRSYRLVHEGREYDAKAIVGVAHKWGEREHALTPGDFSGGTKLVTWLKELGFQVKAVGPEYTELEFTQFLSQVLVKTGHHKVSRDVLLGPGARADIIVESQDRVLIIEVKRVSPQTSLRIEGVIEQLLNYGKLARDGKYNNRKQRLIMAIPGTLASKSTAMLAASGIDVWDGTWVAQKAVEANMQGQATRLLPPAYFDDLPRSAALELSESLKGIPPGGDSWSAYQRLSRDIAEFLFCPPLKSSVWESLDDAGINRRDFILPNYAEDGLWKFLREKYLADYIVVDAKNYTHGIEKKEVIQVANYLSVRGAGLFALIMTRVEPQNSAVYTIKHQWETYGKMIVTLSDNDIQQMLADKNLGNDPSELVRQKIEDFRLGI